MTLSTGQPLPAYSQRLASLQAACSLCDAHGMHASRRQQLSRKKGKTGESGIWSPISRLWVQLSWHHWHTTGCASTQAPGTSQHQHSSKGRHHESSSLSAISVSSSSSHHPPPPGGLFWAVSRRPEGGQNLHFRVEGLTPLATAGRSFCYLPQNPPAAARRPRARWRLHSGSRPNRETGVWSARWVRAEWESRTLGPGRRCQSEASSESVPPRRLGRASPPGPGALACRRT